MKCTLSNSSLTPDPFVETAKTCLELGTRARSGNRAPPECAIPHMFEPSVLESLPLRENVNRRDGMNPRPSTITAAGRRQLAEEEQRWSLVTDAVAKALRFA